MICLPRASILSPIIYLPPPTPQPFRELQERFEGWSWEQEDYAINIKWQIIAEF